MNDAPDPSIEVVISANEENRRLCKEIERLEACIAEFEAKSEQYEYSLDLLIRLVYVAAPQALSLIEYSLAAELERRSDLT